MDTSRPWVLLAGDPPPQPVRFGAAVRWAVKMHGGKWDMGFTVHVLARSERKALRAAERGNPGAKALSATLDAPRRTSTGRRIRLGTEIATLDLEVDLSVRRRGVTWTITRYGEGAGVTVASGAGDRYRSILLPQHVVDGQRFVGHLLNVGALALDRVRTIGAVVHVLLHGVVLQAPVRYPSASVEAVQTHATVGAHPDGGGGYAVVTDPGGIWHVTMQRVRHNEHESDRGPFAAAKHFVELVGEAAAVWSISVARMMAGG